MQADQNTVAARRRQKPILQVVSVYDSATAILDFIEGKTRKHLNTDRMLSNAVIRELEVMGEAANNISKKAQKSFPDIPWKQIIGMRNTLIHAYFDVDFDIVWETVKNDLPLFLQQLKKIVAEKM